jgi:predicted Zn-dependent protease
MANRLLLTALGLIYATAAVWLVHNRAETYRQSLRDHRRSEPIASSVNTPAPEEPKAPEPAPAPRDEPKPPVVEQKTLVAETPAVPTVVPQPKPSGDDPAAKLDPLVIAGIADLSAADEAQLGRLLHELILTNHPADADSPFEKKVVEAARPLFDLRDRKDIEITLTVLASDDVNAFSHLGGYIYVTRGLFNMAASEEEFRFVVGHELAHIEKKHARTLIDKATRAGKLAGIGTLQALYHQVAAGYTEAQEFEADDWVIDRMLQLDQTKRECLAYLRKLVGLSENQGFRNGGRLPKSDINAAVQDVDNHIRSQPAAWKRLSRLEDWFKARESRDGSSSRPATGR